MKLGIFMSLSAMLSAHAAGADLFRAVKNNDVAEVRNLLEKGANPNIKGPRNVTPLMEASLNGSLETMKLLLAAGAGVNEKNGLDATALHWAAPDVERTSLLVDAGADVNARSRPGRTPLLVAASSPGAAGSVRLLLSKGGDPKSRDAMWQTALLNAAYAGDLEMVRIFVEAGSDVNAANILGDTPLMGAAANRDVSMARLLLSKGAKVNAATTSGREVRKGKIALVGLTALMFAVPYGPPDMVKLLLDAGAKVDARDVRGMTPLMLAVASDHADPRIVRLLLDRGADSAAKSESGENILDWARKYANPEVLAMLGDSPAASRGEASRSAPVSAPAKGAVSPEKSLALLLKVNTTFLQEGGCVSCHHQNLTAMAVSAARSAGIHLDESLAAEQVKAAHGMWSSLQEPLLEHVDPPGAIDTVLYALMGFAAAKQPADATIDAMVRYIASSQHSGGHWRLGGLARPPLEDSDIHRTALAIHVLKEYTPPGRREEFEHRLEKARFWLESAVADNNEERTAKLLGLFWAGAERSTLKEMAAGILALQNADGGWSPTRHLASDAYATGQSLYALRTCGALSGDDPSWKRGAAFLIATGQPDGSWHVRSRAPKFQPYFESGFPYGHDQWISAAATAWSVMALASK